MAIDPKTLAYRKSHDLCPRDGRPNQSGRKMCEYCLKKAAEKSERYRQKKIKAGICTNCRENKPVVGSRLCQPCKEKASDYCRGAHVVRYNNRKYMNQCTMCANDAVENKTACQKCLDKQTSLKKNKYDNNSSANKCIQCGSDVSGLKGKRCQTCIDKRNDWYQGSTTQEKDTQRRKERREAVLNHYGGRCVCCGEDEKCFLAIDHTDGEGNAHRKEINKYGSTFFKWLIDEDFPEGFQVLCHNCNMGKHLNGGKCPHRFRNGRPVITREMRKHLPCPFPESEKPL